MEDKKHYQINYRSYLFQIDILEDNKVNISASNSIEGELYEVFNHKLEKIQSRCLVPALEEKQPQTLQAKLTYGQSRQLVLEIVVKYDFIPEMREVIEISQKQVDGEEKLKLLLKQSEKNLYDLQEKLESTKSMKKVSHHKEVQTFNKKNVSTTLLKLDLTPGDYEVTFNFFVNPDGTFVDLQFFLDNQKTEEIPSNGFTINKQQGNQFYPYTLKAIFQLKKKSTVSVQTNCATSNFDAKEMVLLAEKITSLQIN